MRNEYGSAISLEVYCKSLLFLWRRQSPACRATNIHRQHYTGMVCGPSGLLWSDAVKTKLIVIKLINEKVDCPDRIVLRDIVFQLSWKHRFLATMRPAYEAAHATPRLLTWSDSKAESATNKAQLFTRPIALVLSFITRFCRLTRGGFFVWRHSALQIPALIDYHSRPVQRRRG
jgi:hypothetical protein